MVLQDEIAGADVIAGVGILQQAKRAVAVDREEQEPEQQRAEDDVGERGLEPGRGQAPGSRGGRDGDGSHSERITDVIVR